MQTIVTIVLFTVFFAIAKSTIIADHKNEAALAAFEEEILGNPAFDALKQYEPEAMARIYAYLEVALDESHDPLMIQTNSRQILSDTLVLRISKSSDEALLNMSDLLIEQMTFLSKRDDDSCFKYLHPLVDGGLDAIGLFPDEMLSRDYESTAGILSTYDETRQIPSQEQAMTVFVPIVEILNEKHGPENVALLNAAADPNTDRAALCTVTLDLYSQLLARPQDEAILAMRWMFDQINN